MLTGRKKNRGALPRLTADDGPALMVESKDADGNIINVVSLKIAAGGYSVEVIPNMRFTSAADALTWATEWFARKKNEFVTGDFDLLGNTEVTAGTVHEFTGLGSRYTGNWYVAVATHRIDVGSSYVTSVSARKVVV